MGAKREIGRVERLDPPEEARDSDQSVRLLSLFLVFFALSAPATALALDAGQNPAKNAHLDAGALDASVDASTADAAALATEAADAEAETPAVAASAAAIEPEPIPSAVPSAETSDAGSKEEAKDETAPVEVHVHDRTVFTIRAKLGATSIEARAKQAEKALDAIHFEHGQALPDTRIEPAGDTRVVYVGTSPIVTVGADDAKAAGDPNVDVTAEKIAAEIRDVLRSEQKRSQIAESVFSVSLLVFFGLMAFLLLRQTNALLGRARNYFREHPGFLTGLRVGQVELLSRASTRSTVAIGMSIAHRVLQVAIVYAWVVFSLSLFDSTKPYTGKLTGVVVQPLSALIERIGGALPVVVVAGIAAVAVAMLVRFVGLFFEAVARGETKLEWLPADLAPASSILLRGGIIVAALALGSPLVTGSDDGALPRIGLVTILVLGVSAVPLLASAVVGSIVVFARSVRVGDYVEWGGHVGRVKATSLLTLHLEDEAGCDLFVPHLLSLVHPTRVLGHAPLQTIDVVVDPHASQAHAHGVLVGAVMAFRGRVALVRIDGAGAHYRITASDPDENSKNLVLALSGALEQNGITLARGAFSIRPAGPASDDTK